MFVQILFLFIVYSVIGWLWETPYVSIGNKKFVNRGFLRGPYIPIYGLACLTIILTMRVFDGLNQDSIGIVIVELVYIGLISAVWEYGTSWGLEVVFKTRWWDYSNHKVNLNGRIALDYSVLFGIGGFILWRFINPLILTLYSNLSGDILLVAIILFYGFFLLDSYSTLKDLFSLRAVIIEFNKLKAELVTRQDIFLDKLGMRKEISKDYISDLLISLQELKDREKDKLSNSMELKISYLQNSFRNSKNLSRLYRKFPRTPFQFWDEFKERINKKI